jgi:hypothetical protein
VIFSSSRQPAGRDRRSMLQAARFAAKMIEG